MLYAWRAALLLLCELAAMLPVRMPSALPTKQQLQA
jgi:hypothetical protein